jgi:hypothetical protein
MRRQLQKFLPVFLIALMVQILAPIAASWTAAIALAAPPGSAEICLSHAGPPASDEQGTDPSAYHGLCSICCAAQAGPVLDTPNQAVVAVPRRLALPVVWRGEASGPAAVPTGSNTQARAPPHMS